MTFYTLSLETNDTSLITRLELCDNTVFPLGDYSFLNFNNYDDVIQFSCNVFAASGVIIYSITVTDITGGKRIEIKASCDNLIVDTELDSYLFTNESSEDIVVCSQCISIDSGTLIIGLETTGGKLDIVFAPDHNDISSVATVSYTIYIAFQEVVYLRFSDGYLCASMIGDGFYLISATVDEGSIAFEQPICTEPMPCQRLVNCDNKEAIDVFRTLLYKDADNCPVIKIKLTENPVSCLDKCGDMSVGEAYTDAMKLAVVSDLVFAAIPSGAVHSLSCGDVLPATGNAFLSKDVITGCIVVNVVNRGNASSGCSHDCDDHDFILKAISKCGDCYAVNVVVVEQTTDVPYIDCDNASLSTATLVRQLLRKVSDDVYAFAVKVT